VPLAPHLLLEFGVAALVFQTHMLAASFSLFIRQKVTLSISVNTFNLSYPAVLKCGDRMEMLRKPRCVIPVGLVFMVS
jgi:hypothetical protein